jgi:hypothetical protein
MTTTNIKSLTGGPGRSQLIKKLLNMRYTPDEIIEELGLTRYTLNTMIEIGAPVIREGRRVWIHGTSFAEWFVEARKCAMKEVKVKKEKAAKIPYPTDQAYCTACRGHVRYTELKREGRMSYGTCPQGHNVARIVSVKDALNDQQK